MNRTARNIIMRRRRDSRRDREDYGYNRNDYARRNDYHDDYYGRRDDYGGYYFGDYKQGVKGTGRYGIGGSRYDYNDYHDYHDYADEPMRLTKNEMKEWKRNLKNADGSLGEHFDKQEIMQIAERMGLKNDPEEICLTANVLYSDYGEALKGYIPQDKEAIVYTRMAKAFLNDPDAPEGSEKLAIYYHCIANDEEEE